MIRKHLTLMLFGLALLLMTQSCVSVQRMRYRNGLNIQFVKSGKGNPEAYKGKGYRVAFKQKDIHVPLTAAMPVPDTAIETQVLAECADAKQMSLSVAVTEYRQHLDYEQTAAASVKTDVTLASEANTDTGKYRQKDRQLNAQKNSGDSKATTAYSGVNIVMDAILGNIMAAFAVLFIILPALLIPTLGASGIIGILGLIVAYFLSYGGLKTMRNGWRKAKPHPWYLKLLYILLCIPAYLICGFVYVLSQACLQAAGSEDVEIGVFED